jgi:hypothetical protein
MRKLKHTHVKTFITITPLVKMMSWYYHFKKDT